MIWEVSQLIEKDTTIDIADGNNDGDNNDDINIDFAFLLLTDWRKHVNLVNVCITIRGE